MQNTTLKLCSHLTFAFVFASTSLSKFNIASMETQTQTHRMGLNPFLMFYIDVDANANANVKCGHSIIMMSLKNLTKGGIDLMMLFFRAYEGHENCLKYIL